MYKIKKTFEIAIAHHLNLDYDSPCRRDHGHNLKIVVYLASRKLNKGSMVIDFTKVKGIVKDQLDHRNLNEIEGIGYEVELPKKEDEESRWIELNPTAERLAEWICNQFPECYRVDVQESDGNIATYEDEDFWGWLSTLS